MAINWSLKLRLTADYRMANTVVLLSRISESEWPEWPEPERKDKSQQVAETLNFLPTINFISTLALFVVK